MFKTPIVPTDTISIQLSELNQLFNSMDPSPFHERDLDRDAEEFIVSWAQEHHKQHELKLVVHLARQPEGITDPQKLTRESVAHYFDYRAQMTLHELKRLMREGRHSLLIGLIFLAACQVAATLLTPSAAHWQAVVREGLTIIGWVAMWKPLDIYLYRWWPLLVRRRLYQRLAQMPVELRLAA